MAVELRINGATIFCESVGEGRPCICLHGGPGTDASGLARTLSPLAAELDLRLIFYDHRGHGRSEWVPVEQCTQDQFVSDVEGVRQALRLGPVHVLGISWGGFLGLMYAARHPTSIRTLAVVGAAASRDFMARAEDNARRRATAEQWAAYRALWDGSLSGDTSFRRAFDTIRPLYFFDERLATASLLLRAEIRYRLAVRKFIIDHEYPRYDCRPELGRIACPPIYMGAPIWPPSPRLSSRPGGAVARLVNPPDPALDAGRVRAQRPLAARRGAGGVRRRARRYFPVQRAALSDW